MNSQNLCSHEEINLWSLSQLIMTDVADEGIGWCLFVFRKYQKFHVPSEFVYALSGKPSENVCGIEIWLYCLDF
jgi:hypothetical protein